MSTVKEVETTEKKPLEITAKCAVQQAVQIWTDFQQEKMCGKCHPCMLGSFEVLGILNRLADGKGSGREVEFLETISTEMLLGSRCKKGKDVAETLAKLLREGREELNEHLTGSTCRHKECKGLIRYHINTARCTMCGECLDACKYNAIFGEKRSGFTAGYMPFRVRQNRCVKCDACRVVCPEDAVEVVTGPAE